MQTELKKQTIKIKTDEQIKLIAPILILNGYTVHKTVVIKAGGKTKQTVLEYWEEVK